jgi:hypothetical protein
VELSPLIEYQDFMLCCGRARLFDCWIIKK